MPYHSTNIPSDAGVTETTETTNITGSLQVIELKKTVISNQKAQETQDSTFKEVILSPEKIDDANLIKIYEDLFYQIPKKGNLSHEEILVKSNDAVNPEININFDDEIKELNEIILEKNEELLQLELPPQQHPIFPNNTFIREGDLVNNLPIGDTVWFIQNNYKRKITANPPEPFFKLLRKINKDTVTRIVTSQILGSIPVTIPLNDSPLLQLAHPDDINSILEAQDISNINDLSTSPLIAKTEQEYIFSQLRINFRCIGVEKYYKFDNQEKSLFPDDDGYWYIDRDARCELTYQTDVDPSSTFEPKINTITFKNRRKKFISRDPSLYIGDPLTSEFYSAPLNKFNESRDPDNFSTFYPTVNVIQEWGTNNKFPGVVNIKKGSRIKARILSPLNNDGNPIYGQSILINGINNSEGSGQENIFKFFNKKANNGRRMINNICFGPAFCFGKMNQVYDLERPEAVEGDLAIINNNEQIIPNTQSSKRLEWFKNNKKLLDIFNDKNGNYYKKSKSFQYGTWLTGRRTVTGKVYGQPIIKVQNKMCVFLGAYRLNFSDQNVFYDLENDTDIKILNKDLDKSGQVEGYQQNSKAYFNWLRKEDKWDERFNNPTIYYPGLKGSPLNIKNTDLDNNPDYPELDNIGSVFGNILFVRFDLLNFAGGQGNEQLDDNPFNPDVEGSNEGVALSNIYVFNPSEWISNSFSEQESN